MGLKELNLKSVYRTHEDNILTDFYIPALQNSIRYDRAVGFFSAGMLSSAAQGLSAFVNNSGYIRLIFGGELQPEDYAAIKSGYELRASSLENIENTFAAEFEKTVDGVSDILFTKRFELLSFLVANGQLEIKIALRRRGMYHEKIGIFTDGVGDKIVFQGSANETAYALLPDYNFESINLFQSWRSEFADHFEPYINGFEKLWSNSAKDTFIVDFPRASKEKLIAIAKKAPKLLTPTTEVVLNQEEISGDDENSTRLSPEIPSFLGGEEFSIRNHQKLALDSWKSNTFKGVMALATGAGKTITAIYGAVKIFEQTRKLFVVIAVPYQSLADQWVEMLTKFGIYPVKCYVSSTLWVEQFTQKTALYNDNSLNFVCAVVVNATMQSSNFQAIIRTVPSKNFLWIGDECHHHSSENLLKALPANANMRLGLSATPENAWNEDATLKLIGYYGPIVSTYSLAQALTDGVLTPYKYYLILVDLTEKESAEYEELSNKIARASAVAQGGGSDPDSNEGLKLLLIQRARILGKAENKPILLKQLLAEKEPQPLSLFYCGDGSLEDEDSGETTRQVDVVSKTLYQLGWRCSHFTAKESRAERVNILDNFRTGMIDAMVAIKCLDEGIDVPACKTAYILASSRNPKQFIQRRGRILRRSPGKEFAEIYDFIVKIPAGALENSDFEERLILAEFERVIEFASLAINSGDTLKILKPVLAQYDKQHLLTRIYENAPEGDVSDASANPTFHDIE